MAKYNRPNGKLFGSSASNIGVFGSGQTGETPTTSTDPNAINTLGTHWEDGWNGAVVSQAPYTAPFVEDMNAVNYVNSYNSAYLLQRGIPEYSATEEYQKDSVCTYGGEIWICKLDNTVGQTPAEGTYWHLQGEVPIMNANEILVGAVGGTPTVVDTNAQGDVVASATGLNIKTGAIVNADIDASAGIEESKLALDYSTSALEGTISGHIGDTANPHSVTKAQVLSGDPIVNTDVDASAAIEESKLDLDYATDTLNTNIGNVANDLSTHTGDKNNPHETKIANLNDVTITNLQDGDVILYSLADDKYINQQPPGGALTTLTDTAITSPTDKQLVQYDYANSKWTNSSEVWNTIEVNDIANINNASTNVTLTSSDKRHQIFTATDGFNITLPSTGIKAGEKVVLEFTKDGAFSSTSMRIYAGSDAMQYAHIGNFMYIYTALVNNPSTSTDWFFEYRLTRHKYIYGGSGLSISATQNTRLSGQTAIMCTVPPGVWNVNFHTGITYGGTVDSSNPWRFYLVIDGTTRTPITCRGSTEIMGYAYTVSLSRNRSVSFADTNCSSFDCYDARAMSKTSLVTITKRSAGIRAVNSFYNTGSTATIYYANSVAFYLIEPVSASSVT